MTPPSFADFYRAVHGREPFPWQVRLATLVLNEGWQPIATSPRLLDLPTGAGKTSALDVAVYALAVAAERMPRRTVLVVDRRIVVDQAAAHATQLASALGAAVGGPAADIANRLRASWGAGRQDAPFKVTVLRGGMPRDNDWAGRPDQPVIGLSTVDQIGSRLLFRGYGLSDRSRPIHAGLLANDTLILLDEVHLAAPFADTLCVLNERFRAPGDGLPNRFAMVEMSATPGRPSGTPLRLEADDRATPTLLQRLTARKVTTLLELPVPKDGVMAREAIARRAVEQALNLQSSERPVVAIVVNRVDTARLARQQLHAAARTTDALLVTGRMRPIERDAMVNAELLPRAGADRSRASDDRPVIVVATQAIEAGADLDFDGMVTQCASLDALKQRFGRVDRRGALALTQNVVLGPSHEVASDARDPVYGAALPATWRWLQQQASGGAVDFGIDGMNGVAPQGDALLPLLAKRPEAPVLLPTHLDAWVQTSPRPACEPDLSPWLHGIGEAAADVSVVWRADISESTDPRIAQALLTAFRPSSLEAVTLPIGVARAWLEGRRASMADTVFNPEEADDTRAEPPTSVRRPFLWAGDDSRWIGPADLRPGHVIVVPAHWGGIAEANFDPDATDPVSDLAEVAALRSRGRATLRLNPTILQAWGLDTDLTLATPLPSSEPELARDTLARISEWAASWPSTPPVKFAGTAHEWTTLRTALRRISRKPAVIDHLFVATELGRPATSATVDDSVSEDDDSPFRNDRQALTSHLQAVARRTGEYAAALHLSESLRHDLMLAARLHDLGKADPRFQAWLRGGVAPTDRDGLLAKSSLPPGHRREREEARVRAEYPVGYRHELLSMAMASGSDALAKANDPDLVLHLIGSHHGWCRPFPPLEDDAAEIGVTMTVDGHAFTGSTRHGLARLDSGVAARYWSLIDRYGRWGLAWLEGIMRLADHRVSEEGEA